MLELRKLLTQLNKYEGGFITSDLELTICCSCVNWYDPADSERCKGCKYNEVYKGLKDNFREG